MKEEKSTFEKDNFDTRKVTLEKVAAVRNL